VSAKALATCNGTPSQSSSCPAFPFTVTDKFGTVYNFPWIGALYGKDGTYFFFPSTLEDRNGNVMNVSVNTGPNFIVPPLGETVTDTIGRPVIQTSRAASDPGPTTYVVGGLTYKITYTTATASYTLPSQPVGPAVPSQDTCSPTFVVPNSAPGTGNTLPPNSGISNVIQSITLPNGKQYVFHYDNNPYGLISEIDYPDGGWVKYTWKLSDEMSDFAGFNGSFFLFGQIQAAPAICNYIYKTPVVDTRTVGFSSGTTPSLTQTFTYNTQWDSQTYGQWDFKKSTVQTTDNVTNKTAQTIYTYGSVSAPSPPDSPTYGFGIQLPVETSVQYYDWGNTTTPLRTVNEAWGDQFSMTSEQTVLDNGQIAKTTYCYDTSNCALGGSLLQEKDEYDFGQSSPTRKTTYSYYGFAEPCKIVISDNNGHPAAETDGYYDGATSICGSGGASTTPVNDLPPNTHDETKYGASSTTPRGNLTQLVKWSNSGVSSTTTYTYDETGQVHSMTDPCGNFA
jgi:hypothetical protein